jgi:hypothetical protein
MHAANHVAIPPQRGAHDDQVGVVHHVATGRPQVQNTPTSRCDIAEGVQVGHHVMPQLLLIARGSSEIDAVQPAFEGGDLLGGDIEAELALGLSQGDPQLPPDGDALGRAEEP